MRCRIPRKIPRCCQRRIGVGTGNRQDMNRPSRTLHPACVGPHRAQAIRDLEKTPRSVQTRTRDSAARGPRHALHCLEWPAGKANAEVRYLRSQQQATWYCHLHGRLSHYRPVWLGIHIQAMWKDCTRRRWCPQSDDLQSDHEGRSSHRCNSVASLPTWRTNYINQWPILTDLMKLLEWWSLKWSLRLQRLLWIYWPVHAGVSGNKRICVLATTADITLGLQLGRADVPKGLRGFLNMNRLEHHSTDRLKEREM